MPGQSYVVPRIEDLAKPVKREIDFVDTKRTKKEHIVSFQSDICTYAFSNYGGTLSHLDFKKHKGVNKIPLKTVHYKTFYEQEQGFFLLAFDEKTPYFYTLIDSHETDNQIHITYQAQKDGWTINKKYEIDKRSYNLQLSLEFIPSSDKSEPLKPRLFFAAPFVAELEDNAIQGVTSSVGSTYVMNVDRAEESEQAWVMPELFGGQNKYFAHILVKDTAHFTQRAFYKRAGDVNLFAILEGPIVKEKQCFSMSFYLGPKLIDELVRVDLRLEGLLAFGWLSWI